MATPPKMIGMVPTAISAIRCRPGWAEKAGLGPIADAFEHVEQIAAEIEEDGNQAAEMHGDVEGQSLIGPAGQQRDEDKVTARADRQEFGEALNET